MRAIIPASMIGQPRGNFPRHRNRAATMTSTLEQKSAIRIVCAFVTQPLVVIDLTTSPIT